VLVFGPGLLSIDALLKRVVGQIDFPRPGRSLGTSLQRNGRK
jgi:hypothetical protein